MKLRIQFTKHGAMKFIGHLDTMRYFQKAIRRSGIDISYTGGFSPHQIMAFAHPLGVGTESESEIVDIEVNSLNGNRAEMTDILNAQMSEGFTIRDIRLLPDNAANAMASVAAASYSVRIISSGPQIDYERAVKAILDKEEVLILKKTKKSETMTDIRPRIYELSYRDECINMCVDASSAGNVKPEHVINALYQAEENALFDGRLKIVRNEIYGRLDSGELIPLIDLGTDF